MCALLVVGCGDDNASDPVYTPPSEYTFTSRTNTDFNSSVSNDVAATQFILKSELLSYVRSSEIKTVLSAEEADSRLDQIFSQGVERLQNYNIYTGLNAEPTAVSLDLDSGLSILVNDYSDITTETNLVDDLQSGSAARALSNKTLVDVDNDGVVTKELLGDFIGWPLLADIVDGDEMAKGLVDDWFAQIALMSVDGDDATGYVSTDGIHFDLILDQFLLGSINYSLVAQYNLRSDEGLLKQNTDPLNYSVVLEQEAEVEVEEARLEFEEENLIANEELLEQMLNDWLAADPEADITKDLAFYSNPDNYFQYGPIDLAESYFDQEKKVLDKKESITTFEKKVITAKEKVDALLPYTDLANVWDQSFGYFGAARNYGFYTDSEIVSKPDYDENGDGFIDVYTELNTAFAVLASERDAGAALVNTDFSGNMWNAFLLGREIIQQNHGREPKEFVGYHNELKEQADIILENLEKVLAASIIHNINAAIISIDEALVDEDASEFDSNDYEYFKLWSTLKGLALGLQFNDDPIISKSDLVDLHVKIGEVPRPETNNLYGARKFNLEEARDILQQAYNFAPANVEAW